MVRFPTWTSGPCSFSGGSRKLPRVEHVVSPRFVGLAHYDVKWGELKVIFVVGHRASLGGP